MKVYKTLGSKQKIIDKGQALLMGFFFFVGAIYENVSFLLILPTLVFVVTFLIKEKFFDGKPEWGIFVLRMLSGKTIYYSRQFKDFIDLKKDK